MCGCRVKICLCKSKGEASADWCPFVRLPRCPLFEGTMDLWICYHRSVDMVPEVGSHQGVDGRRAVAG